MILKKHLIKKYVAQRNYSKAVILEKKFKNDSDPKSKGGAHPISADLIKYTIIPLIFAAALAILFDNNLHKLHDLGEEISGVMEGTFTILLSLIFAIIGVYLVVHVLHPNFGKRPVPAKLRHIAAEKGAEDMNREELFEFVTELGSGDEEIEEYLDTIDVKTDVAVTLGLALIAFFLGMYGYVASFTIGYAANPNLLWISLCFMYVIFSIVYTILRTMKVVWDV